MGNTCGSCSFDNRGSEFDMEPKDKYVPQTSNADNIQNNRKDYAGGVGVEPVAKARVEQTKGAAPQQHFNYQEKENSAPYQNQQFNQHYEVEKQYGKNYNIFGQSSFSDFRARSG